MKAKVINSRSKYYGRIVNVRKMEDSHFFANRYKMVYGKGVFFGDELDFNITTVNNPVSFDWSAFRREAAKDILAGMMAHQRITYGSNYGVLAKYAISYADELINQLKQEQP